MGNSSYQAHKKFEDYIKTLDVEISTNKHDNYYSILFKTKHQPNRHSSTSSSTSDTIPITVSPAKIKLSCEYIQEYKDPIVLLANDNILIVLYNIDHLCHQTDQNHEKENLIDRIVMADIDLIFIDVLRFCLHDIKQHVINGTASEHKINERKFMCVAIILDIIWKLTDFSQHFRVKFHQKNGLQSIIDYIVDEKFIRALSTFHCTNEMIEDKSDDDQIVITKSRKLIEDINLLKSLCGCIHNMTKICDQYKFDFNQLQLTEILMKFSRQIRSQQCTSTWLSIYLAISNCINDKEIDTLMGDLIVISKDIIKLIKIATKSLQTSINLNRCKINCDEEVCYIEYDGTLWNTVELLEGIYKFSINDSIKYVYYEQMRLKEDLEIVFKHGNNVELFYASKLLWQLCFDKKVSNRLFTYDKSLYEAVCKLSNEKRLYKSELNQNIAGIHWCIKKYCKPPMATATPQKKDIKSWIKGTTNSNPEAEALVETAGVKVEADFSYKQIMISYQHDDKETCLRIKSELESNGYTVIIDIDDIHGSCLEWMAQAIEKSFFVLICITEKYKKSPNCRAEAEYAFRLNKNIIPCILQNQYQADGWLGILLATRIYIDFSQGSTFTQSFDKLRKQLDLHLKPIPVEPVKPTHSPTPLKTSMSTEQLKESKKENGLNKVSSANLAKNGNIDNWNENDVNKWLNSNSNIDFRIKVQFKNCNGQILKRFFETKTQAPEYFFSSVSKNGSIEICSVFKFINELEALFCI